MPFKIYKQLKIFVYILLGLLIAVFGQACDSVNTDSAEETIKGTYPKTNTGSFPAKMHFKTLNGGTYKYWNENLGTKFNGEIQQLACSDTVPVNPSYYNLNDQDPNLALEYKYSLDRNSMPTSWSSIAEWPMNVDGTIYSEGKYEVHSWLKDSFNKPLYAGSDIIHFDNNSPVFEATLLRSNAVIIDLVINDLTFDFNKFSQDLISNPILINDNFSIGDTKPNCSGKIQLQELGDNVSNKCIPFESQPLWGIDSDNISKNFLRIRAPELVQSLEHFVTIDGTIIDCSGNISIADQTTSFTTVDMGGPSILSVSVETNNSNNNKLSKINDNIIVKFLSSEKLSNHPNSTTANGQDNYPPPTVSMWVGNRTSDKQSVLAVLDNTDPTERSWIATFNTTNTLSTWNNSTSQEGDNISFSIHDYYDVNYDQQVGWAENPGVDIISTDDNLTITGVYDGLNVIFDNQPPDNISMSQLVSNNQLIDRFRPDEKAFFNFKVNEPVYLPEIQIGGLIM